MVQLKHSVIQSLGPGGKKEYLVERRVLEARGKKRSFGCIMDKHKIPFRKTKLFLYFIKDLKTRWRKGLIAD